jgi:hypothetical protein
MSTTEQQLLYWVLNSLSGGELPIKQTIDGTEFIVIYNPDTKKVERIKNNANDTTKLWSQYIGDFTDDSGVLKLGKLDGNLTIQIDSTTNQIELKGLTEIQEARILTDFEVNGDFSTDESVRIKSNNGSLTLEYTENGDFTQTLQAKDGIIATLDDLPDIDLSNYVTYNGGDQNLDLSNNVVFASSFLGSTVNGTIRANSLSAQGQDPFVKINNTINGDSVEIKLNDVSGDIIIKTPSKDGTLLVDEDLNNTVTFNNQNAIVVNNPDAEEVNGSLTKGEILFTDSSVGTVFKDFSIRKEDYQDNFLVKGSRLIISEIDSSNNVTDYLTFANNTTIINGNLSTESINSQGRLIISNDDGEIELFDSTSNFFLKLNSNLITQDRVLQAPNESGVIALKGNTGWAQYSDTQYTSANPLVITQGNTGTISLDGLTGTVKTQMPSNTTDLFDVSTSKITPIKSGDGYCLSLGFNASTNNNSGDFDIFLDIGGSFTKFKAENKTFPKGSGVVRPFMYNISAFYAGDTFLANGGFIKVTSNTGTTSLFDFDLQIHKTHDAR